MSFLNWQLETENRVKDLALNKKGRYGIIYQWKHRHGDYYTTVKRTSSGYYEVLHGESKRPSRQEPVENFMHGNYEDAAQRAKKWMQQHPEPLEDSEEEYII